MSTLLDLGSGALTAIGQLGAGQTANPEDGALILRYSNLLLSQWSTSRLYLYYVAIRQYALAVSASASYTIGPTGSTFTAARPVLIESAQVQVGNTTIWLPMNILDKAKWDAIVTKGSVDDIATDIYPEYNYPNITFYVNPAVRAATNIRLGCWEQLTQFASLFDTIAFPPAYEEFLESSLGIILAPFYDQVVPNTLIQRQATAQMAVMRINAQSLGGALGPTQTLQSPNVGNPIPTGAQ